MPPVWLGMSEGLPKEVQDLLRQREQAAARAAATPISLDLEARDPRTASDIVLQFVAYRPAAGAAATPPPASMYLTFNFFHYAAITTEHAYLVNSNTLTSASAAAEEQANTFLLLPAGQVSQTV